MGALSSIFVSMKKIIIAALSLVTSLGAWAEEVYSIDYSPAGKNALAKSMDGQVKGQGFAQALEITPELTTQYAGCEITSFNFYLPSHVAQKQNRIFDYTIFITEELDEEPILTQEYHTTRTSQMQRMKVTLDEPYKLEAGKSFYVGMQYKLTSQYDQSFVVDGLDPQGDYTAGWIGVLQDDGSYFWDNYTDRFSSLCLGVTISGSTLPVDQAVVQSVSTQSVVTPGEPFSYQLIFQNVGATDVKTIEVEYSIGAGEPTVETYDYGNKAIAYNNFGVLTFSDLIYNTVSPDDVTIKAKITKINDVANEATPNEGSTTFLCLEPGTGYERQVVIEEITGTWCGNCPLGIITMERIRKENPTGGIIPIAVHFNDDMQQDSWYDVIAISGGTAPFAVFNRYTSCHPGDYNAVMEVCNQIKSIPAIAKVDVEASFDNNEHSVTVTANTEFAFNYSDAAKRYRLAIALTQDNVGPYEQTNYLSGADGDYDGWENKPSEASTMFNDVAINLDSYTGIVGSIPNEVVAGESYEFTRAYNVKNYIPLDDLNVVVYLINAQTGIIETAAVQKAKSATSGIELPTVATDDNGAAAVEYFNLQGMRVSNPKTGIFIRRQGNTVTKVTM